MSKSFLVFESRCESCGKVVKYKPDADYIEYFLSNIDTQELKCIYCGAHVRFIVRGKKMYTVEHYTRDSKTKQYIKLKTRW